MKRNMKKLLVIALALMPSLSISVMAQSPGGGPSDPDPEVIPVKPQPSPIPNPAPRCLPDDPDGIPIDPFPQPDPTPGINPGPRVRSNGPDDIPVVPGPGTNPGDGPRFRNSAQTPHCYHIGGVVYIDADATITYINASVTRYDDNQVWSDASSTNTLGITTSTDAGSYLLELTLSNGQSYKGKYIIE